MGRRKSTVSAKFHIVLHNQDNIDLMNDPKSTPNMSAFIENLITAYRERLDGAVKVEIKDDKAVNIKTDIEAFKTLAAPQEPSKIEVETYLNRLDSKTNIDEY